MSRTCSVLLPFSDCMDCHRTRRTMVRSVTDVAERQQYFGYRITVRDLCRLIR